MAHSQQHPSLGQPDDMTVRSKHAESHPQPAIATESSLFEDDLDENPHSHFLSPVHTYESWDDSDNESDDGSYPLDAGIVDFALFNDDFNRAKEQNLPLPDKWDGLIIDQAEALDRAVARSRAELTDRSAAAGFSQPRDAVPGLTPDTSPRLADDLDFDGPSPSASETSEPTRTANHATSSPIAIPARPSDRAQLNTIAESAIDDTDFDDPATPAFLLYQHSQRTERRRRLSPTSQPASQPPPSQSPPPLLRPGLSAGRRTLSGKLHVWKRPSGELWPVFEEADEDAAPAEPAAARLPHDALRRKRGRQELRG